jgi:hypothetical protein
MSPSVTPQSEADVTVAEAGRSVEQVRSPANPLALDPLGPVVGRPTRDPLPPADPLALVPPARSSGSAEGSG